MSKKIDATEIWKIALAQIEVKLDNQQHFKTWFGGTKLLELEGTKAIVGVRNHYAADWLRRKYLPIIEDTLAYLCDQRLKVDFKIDEDLANQPLPKAIPNTGLSNNPYGINPSLLDVRGGMSGDLQSSLARNKINSKYTFETYVVGDSNQMAVAAAKAVGAAPGVAYNPYFLYGTTGLGKTHIAQAIARAVLEKNPDKNVVYVPAETFLNEMITAIRANKSGKFREKYRDHCDLLIIDDVQFISNWEQTQTEFFNTFNALQSAGKQIIIISDRSPDELDKLTPRLKSRFLGGIVVDVSKPSIEHRVAIMQAKLQTLGNPEISNDILQFIAKNITDNIRELEGALQKIVLLKNILGKPNELTLELVAKQLGKDMVSKRRKIAVPSVLKAVSATFDIKVSELKSERRTADIALARQVCMYIMREELGYKLEEIARVLNRKDHTTVIHGIEKVTSRRQADEGFRAQLLNVIEGLQS